MKLKLVVISLFVLVAGCTDTKTNHKTAEIITFGDLVDLSKLEKVIMHNNSGTFELTTAQREKLKKELSNMIYEPDLAIKTGSIAINLFIAGQKHTLSSKTNDAYIEAHKSIVTKKQHVIRTNEWICFATNKVNFDNYKKEN